ncbi:hypothetical protein HPSD74_1317 [Glaesserella parasuis D74]|nr:hypothetical protein HPSD74_1317 [Glaesserella parasuis D74]
MLRNSIKRSDQRENLQKNVEILPLMSHSLIKYSGFYFCQNR